mmetsp:Transcript_3972/g.6252  ORF Transcript_3972/g.6252 Transcript_3972/m.6252 type:complete len:316 (+) Transcript_3972:117-1064(+)
MIDIPKQHHQEGGVAREGSFIPNFFESEKALPVIDDCMEVDEDNDMYGQIIPVENQPPPGQIQDQEVLLYLIRHGEAEHNIEEKKAMAEARRKAVEEEGLPEDDPKVAELVEAARKSVLNDEKLRDARLSDFGKHEAEEARQKLQNIVKEKFLPPPSYVLVSPLTRTLETCDIIFPDHNSIHVRGDLCERQTGKPPDTMSPVHSLSMRSSFQRFSMQTLRSAVMANERKKDKQARRRSSGAASQTSQRQNQKTLTHSQSQPEVFLMNDNLWSRVQMNGDLFTEEDKAELRKRTEKLFALLCEAKTDSVACVTHKG